MDDNGLDWMCEQCAKKKPSDLHPYTHKLLRVRRLKQAGYPLGSEDLTFEEWLDLGRLEQCLEAPRLSTSK